MINCADTFHLPIHHPNNTVHNLQKKPNTYTNTYIYIYICTCTERETEELCHHIIYLVASVSSYFCTGSSIILQERTRVKTRLHKNTLRWEHYGI
ncbi:hypothetical protein Pfo_006773 [Paulownia fortunei]|nr:hypothetical protein Pfo_006773 [Paulownia fortunei]